MNGPEPSDTASSTPPQSGIWSTGRSPDCDLDNSSSSSSGLCWPSGQQAQWQQHIALRDFTKKLDLALSSVFPNKDRSPYSRFFVLLLRRQLGDPKLPVAVEVEDLRKVFTDVFHFEVEVFEIPSAQSHIVVSQKINEFALRNRNSKDDLKIFYYGGHSKLTRSKDLIFSRSVQVLRYTRAAAKVGSH